MSLHGGYGQVAWGRSSYGSPSPSVIPQIEPRFNYSNPRDESSNVNKYSKAIFEVYYYETTYPPPMVHAHWGIVPKIKVEVSLDAGATYVTLFDPVTMVGDLPGYTVMAGYKGGQRIRIVVTKVAGWPSEGTVIFRYTGPDEFGQDATKNPAVVWR